MAAALVESEPARSPRIALIAGEASGDQLGAGLLDALRQRYPNAQFAGIGGPRMSAHGFDSWYPMETLSVMGLAEVLRHLPSLLRLRRDLVARLLAWRPDVVIGIDAPDFNLTVERRLKEAGVRTVHYVSPSVWAWRERRAERIGRSADRVLCLFPMEPPIYARHGIPASFVGHPLADSFAMHPDRAAARQALGLPVDAVVLALLPGSRLGEIRRLGKVFVEAAQRCQAAVPGLVIVAPMANTSCRTAFEALLTAPDRNLFRVLDGRAHEAMIAADAVLLASGTAALEAMLAKRPMVVAYKLAPLTYWIVRLFRLMKIQRYSLPNVLAGAALVPELLQSAATPEALADALLPYLRDPSAQAPLIAQFEAIHAQLRGDASHCAAAAIADLLEAPRA